MVDTDSGKKHLEDTLYDFGCRFVQPVRATVSPETFALCKELGLRANVFCSDDPEEAKALYEMGAGGVMTTRIPLLAPSFCQTPSTAGASLPHKP